MSRTDQSRGERNFRSEHARRASQSWAGEPNRCPKPRLTMEPADAEVGGSAARPVERCPLVRLWGTGTCRTRQVSLRMGLRGPQAGILTG